LDFHVTLRQMHHMAVNPIRKKGEGSDEKSYSDFQIRFFLVTGFVLQCSHLHIVVAYFGASLDQITLNIHY